VKTRRHRQIVHGIGANAYAQLVNILLQAMTIPFFLHAWGAEKYGDWLILSAVPSFLNQSDFGFSAVIGNLISMHDARCEYEQCKRLFSGGFAIAIGLSSAFFIVLIIGFLGASWLQIYQLQSFSGVEVLVAFLGLCVYMAGTVHSGFIFVVLRGCGQQAPATLALNSIRIGEFAAGMAALYATHDAGAVACAYALARLACNAWFYLYMRRSIAWAGYSSAAIDWPMMRSLVGPSLSFSLVPLALTLSVQGPIMIIGKLLGAEAVTSFSALRTLSRVGLQAVNAVNMALWPEVTRAFGQGDLKAIRELFRRYMIIDTALSVLYVAAVLLLGPFFLKWWTHGAVQMDWSLFTALILASLLYVTWHLANTILNATNHHRGTAQAYLLINIVALAFAWLLAVHGTTALMVPLVIGEIVMNLFVWRHFSRVFGAASVAGTGAVS
jgi:O-antigen/teichoic acid export membrane protein